MGFLGMMAITAITTCTWWWLCIIISMQTWGVTGHLGLLQIITYYFRSLQTSILQLEFVAEEDISALDIYRLAVAINLDRQLQPTVQYVVWAQDKPLRRGWTTGSEDEVLSIISMDHGTTCLGTASTEKRCCPSWILCSALSVMSRRRGCVPLP